MMQPYCATGICTDYHVLDVATAVLLLLLSQKVVRSIEAASYVMTELSKNKDEMDKSILHVAATGFVQQVQVRCSSNGQWCSTHGVQPMACSPVYPHAAASAAAFSSCSLDVPGPCMQEAQQLVLQAVKSAAPERNFEANNYFAMVQV
jgi:hypothetical protein